LLEGNALFGVGCSVQPDGAVLVIGDQVSVHDSGSRIIPAPI
jgi:hypothetical protein